MAIARDNASVGTTSSTTSTLTFSHTVSGSDRYLVVAIACNSALGIASFSSVTYNGVSMTLIGAQNTGSGNGRSELWGLVAPATGANNVVCTRSSSALNGFAALAISFTGVDQTTPVGTAQTASSTGSGTVSVTVTSASGEWVIDSAIRNTNSGTVGGGQTSEMNQQAGGATARAMSSTAPGASSVTMTWTGASVAWGTVAVNLKPVAAGGDVVLFRRRISEE